jgi:hypothetical protein
LEGVLRRLEGGLRLEVERVRETAEGICVVRLLLEDGNT